MVDYSLAAKELAELRTADRRTRDKCEAHRIKAVALLASGRTAEDIADALLIDPNTLRHHFKRYQQGGLPAFPATSPTAKLLVRKARPTRGSPRSIPPAIAIKPDRDRERSVLRIRRDSDPTL